MLLFRDFTLLLSTDDRIPPEQHRKTILFGKCLIQVCEMELYKIKILK